MEDQLTYLEKVKELDTIGPDRDLIKLLTVIASEHMQAGHAINIANLLVTRVNESLPKHKLPVLYLIDSILKVVGKDYLTIFRPVIESLFCDTFALVEPNTRKSLLGLHKTWVDTKLFDASLLASMRDRAEILQTPPSTLAPLASNLIITPPTLIRTPIPVQDATIEEEDSRRLRELEEQLAEIERRREVLRLQELDQQLAHEMERKKQQQQQSLDLQRALTDPTTTLNLQQLLSSTSLSQAIAAVTGATTNPQQQQQHSSINALGYPPSTTAIVSPTPTTTVTVISSTAAQPSPIAMPVQPFPGMMTGVVPNPGVAPMPDWSAMLPFPGMMTAPISAMALHPITGLPLPQIAPPNPQMMQQQMMEQFHQFMMQQQMMMEQQAKLQQEQLAAGGAQTQAGPSGVSTTSPAVAVKREGSGVANTLTGKDGLSDTAVKTASSAPLDFSNFTDPARHPTTLIAALYDNKHVQCVQCGLRFRDKSKLDPHLDWHFRNNKREKDKSKKAFSRHWYLPLSLWTSDEVIVPDEMILKREQDLDENSDEEETQSLVVARDQQNCPVCGEKFRQIYDPDIEEWFFIDAVLNTSEDLIYHRTCSTNLSLSRNATPTKSLSSSGNASDYGGARMTIEGADESAMQVEPARVKEETNNDSRSDVGDAVNNPLRENHEIEIEGNGEKSLKRNFELETQDQQDPTQTKKPKHFDSRSANDIDAIVGDVL